MTIDSKKETERHAFFILEKESVVARKHTVRVDLRGSTCAELRKVLYSRDSQDPNSDEKSVP